MHHRILKGLLAGLGVVALAGPVLAQAESRRLKTESGEVAVETFARGLENPWGAVFLPDGRLLVTERSGRLRVVAQDGKLSEPLQGTPRVFAQGQGGLLDVALDPGFRENRLVYLTYSEPREGGAATAAGRGWLNQDATALEDFQVIFRQQPAVSGGLHFGSRLAFSPDGKLFVTMGDRGKLDPAQDPTNHIGTVVRLNPDGSVPADNPFAGRKDARPEIWSYGHRNVQGAGFHPQSGILWTHEYGPRNGDEVNLPEPGKNYGWPVVSWGRHYDGRDIPDPPTRPEFAQSLHHWVPAVSPSGLAFYQGDAFPAWRGHALIGGMSSRLLVRLATDGRRITGEERLDLGARIREVEVGPDGLIYLFTDASDGRILRLRPAGQS